MTPQEWRTICGLVANAMKVYTRPFVTPLRGSSEYDVWLVGRGSYVTLRDRRILLTCEHVERKGPVEYWFDGSDSVFRHRGPFAKDADLDICFGEISDEAWDLPRHQAIPIPYERFASAHHVVDCSELLFFRGFAGENANYGFGIHDANATGYCSQQKVVEAPDPNVFDVFWEPEMTKFAEGTSKEAQTNIKLNNPKGFSGSLVWNTRYIEVTAAGRNWNPNDAVVTGLLRRWDQDAKTLLVLRVEHLRAWLDQHM